MSTQESGQLQQPLINEAENKPAQAPAQPPPLPPSSFSALFAHTTGPQRVMLIIGSIAALVAGAVFPFFLIYFSDVTTIFAEENRDNAIHNGFKLFWEFFIIGAVTWAGNGIGSYCFNMVGSTQATRIKKLYYKALLEQEVAYYDQNDPHKVVTKVSTSLAAIQTATGQKISLLLTTSVTSVASIFLAFFKCWQLSLALMATLPILLIIFTFFTKALLMYSQREKVSYESAASRTEQALGQIRTVKGLVGQQYEMEQFQTKLDQGKKKTFKFNVMKAVGQALIILVFIGIYAFGFWYGKKLIIDNIDTGKYDAAVILSTFFCFLVGGSSVGQLTPMMKSIAEGRVAMAEFIEITTRKKSLQQPENGKKMERIKNIELKQVQFQYKPDQPVLRGINIHFDDGKVSALVGQSGCGKSTIVQLLLRYYDCVEGSLTVDGVDIKELDMSHFRKKVGFVGQQPVLFAMSIKQNLKLANPSLSEDQMIKYLKKANAWQFVERMQKKLDTYVGSGGAQLSGGQKQRIAIARALCKGAEMLVLDEATSALDRKNERQIQATLSNLDNNRITTVVIAHRLSTIKNADCIYVMKKGEVMERGKHEDLLNQNGQYAELVKTQIAAESNLAEVHAAKEQAINEEEEKSQESTMLDDKAEEKKEEPPKEKQDAVFRKLMKFQKANGPLLLIGVLGTLVAGLTWPFFNYVFSGVLSLMIDPVTNNDILNRYCLYFLLIAVVSGVATGAYTLAFGLASENLVYKVRISMFNKLLRLPVSYYDKKQNTAGAISSRLATDAFQLNNMVSGVLGVMCLNLATVASSLIIAFVYSWKVTLIALGLSPLLVIVGSLNMKLHLKLTTKSQEAQKFLGSLMSDSVCNIRTVKSMGRNEVFEKIFDDKLDEVQAVNSEKHCKTSILSGMGKGMIMFVEGTIFLLAAILFYNHQVEDGRAVFTATFSIIFAAMGIGQNSQFMPDMAKAKFAGAGIFDILESKGEDEISVENGGTAPADIRGHITFKNVTFKYPEREKVVLENLSFDLGRQKVALVGHSGSGKSTIIQLLMRFYDVSEGQISIDGKDIKGYNLYELRKKIGSVSQEPALFMGTVNQNIRYNSGCSDRDIEQAVSTANANGFINQWDEKFEKEVGEKGGQVSGGQKQRIALSRCLVRQPAMFLFDEFTSALDADTERTVFENMKPILREKTSVSVAHRLSTVEDCDRILVFKDGRIIEEGTYQTLMDNRSHFYSLAQGM